MRNLWAECDTVRTFTELQAFLFYILGFSYVCFINVCGGKDNSTRACNKKKEIKYLIKCKRVFVCYLGNGSGAASPGVKHHSIFMSFLQHLILPKGDKEDSDVYVCVHFHCN